MGIKVIKPTWEAKSSGLAIQREGTVLLEFAPNVGTQTYDWTRKEVRAWWGGGPAGTPVGLLRRISWNKQSVRGAHATCLQTFALSAVECAGVLDAADARQEWSAYHDPNKNSAGEGTIRKQLA